MKSKYSVSNSMPNEDGQTSGSDDIPDRGRWRDLVAYWILGLCNNYGYVVMLTAAHDILRDLDDHETGRSVSISGLTDFDSEGPFERRPCNKISTGAILLADVLPGLTIKLIASFFPLWKHARVFLAVLLAAAGFLLVALATVDWMIFLGVMCTSFSSGLGEATFLAYASYFHRYVISTWSSGTGGAGIIGSISYTGLRALKLSPKTTVLTMLVVPAVEAAAFWLLLRHKDTNLPSMSNRAENDDGNKVDRDLIPENERPLENWRQKVRYIPSLFFYMIPLLLVYIFEYFINQGLFEFIYFPGIWLDHAEQYRVYQVLYQVGVFISRSSVNIVQFKHVWIMAVLQLVNVVIFTFEAIHTYMPTIWIVFVLILWEGLLGGGGYVNTFYRMQQEIPVARREYAMMVTSVSDSLGVALAGVVAIPSHNVICDLPVPDRLLNFGS
ncbi:battenin-like [Uranotaenia lowii]|uniref:battenin-like n=1 Tax=Uranotaenia lowii TaxID=190385 RepID=UPI0024787737|nr:battenin-like [Uranotaenia lowii]